MAKRTTKNFAGPAQKYAGQVKLDGGPVPLQRWHRPYTRDEFDRPDGHQGIDLRGEADARQSSPPPGTQTGGNYNRQAKRN